MVPQARELFLRDSSGGLPCFPSTPGRGGGSDEYKDGAPYKSDRLVEDPFHLGRLEWTMELAKSCIRYEKRSLRILDLDCGEGHFTIKLQEYFPLSEVSGLDYSISTIRRAVQNYRAHGIEFIVADACTPPICLDISI